MIVWATWQLSYRKTDSFMMKNFPIRDISEKNVFASSSDFDKL
jgi:hypothetical protein